MHTYLEYVHCMHTKMTLLFLPVQFRLLPAFTLCAWNDDSLNSRKRSLHFRHSNQFSVLGWDCPYCNLLSHFHMNSKKHNREPDLRTQTCTWHAIHVNWAPCWFYRSAKCFRPHCPQSWDNCYGLLDLKLSINQSHCPRWGYRGCRNEAPPGGSPGLSKDLSFL